MHLITIPCPDTRDHMNILIKKHSKYLLLVRSISTDPNENYDMIDSITHHARYFDTPVYLVLVDPKVHTEVASYLQMTQSNKLYAYILGNKQYICTDTHTQTIESFFFLCRTHMNSL